MRRRSQYVPTFFLYTSAHHRDVHSFPTRRSSDLYPAAAPQDSQLHGTALAAISRRKRSRRPIRLAEGFCALPPLLSRTSRRERSEEHTSELQSLRHLVCRLLLEKKNLKGHCITDR